MGVRCTCLVVVKTLCGCDRAMHDNVDQDSSYDAIDLYKTRNQSLLVLGRPETESLLAEGTPKEDF